MLTENLPNCLCGSHQFTSGGGTLGRGSTHWFVCQVCDRALWVVQHACSVILTQSGAPRGGPDSETAFEISDPTWVQTDFELWLRSKRLQADVTRKKLEAACWEIACDELGLSHDIKFKEYRDDPTSTDAVRKPLLRIWQNPDGTEMTDQAIDKAFEERQDHLRVVLGWDGGLTTINIPPRIPRSLAVAIPRSPARTQTRENWRWVGYEDAKDIPVPPDSVREAHDKAYLSIFQSAGAATGTVFHPVEIANRYYSDPTHSQPWFQFTVGACRYTVGPRKRVIELRIEAEQSGLVDPPKFIPTKELAALADRDKVTYEATGGNGLLGFAQSVLIHAWSDERAVEYLTAMLKTGSSVPVSE